MQINFNNKTVIITGGTRGIGASLTEVFHTLGAHVYSTGTHKEVLEQLNNSPDSNNRKKYLHLDFTIPESVENFLKIVEKLERIDVLINNAGVNKISSIEATQDEDWDWINCVNLRGPYKMTKAIARKMQVQKSGKIINIASIFGVISKSKRSVYSSTKWGLIGFTKGVALDLAPYNILVNSVSPGFVNTELTRKILSQKDIGQLENEIPLHRFAQPDEIVKVILFLASEHNTYLTGQNIIIDGGFVSR